MYSDIVTIKVGSRAKIVRIHKALLCGTSAYFKCCLNGSFREAATNVVELSDVQPAVFEVLVTYLYKSGLRPNLANITPEDIKTLIYAWMLADRLVMPGAKNEIMDLIQKIVTNFASKRDDDGDRDIVISGLRFIRDLDEKPLESNSLYRFFVERASWSLAERFLVKSAISEADFPAGAQDLIGKGGKVMIDVFIAHSKFLRTGPSEGGHRAEDPATRRDCAYHEHANDNMNPCKQDLPRIPKLSSAPAPSKW